MKHKLDFWEIDEVDEISGDEQLVLIWCETHGRYENHWVLIEDIEYPDIIEYND